MYRDVSIVYLNGWKIKKISELNSERKSVSKIKIVEGAGGSEGCGEAAGGTLSLHVYLQPRMFVTRLFSSKEKFEKNFPL